jgi:uncharacterized protein (UPF0335 family)
MIYTLKKERLNMEEILKQILSKMESMENEMKELKRDVKEIKQDVKLIKMDLKAHRMETETYFESLERKTMNAIYKDYKNN